MGIQERIKTNILQEVNGKIDEIYDLLHRRFIIDEQGDQDLVFKLNALKDSLFTLAGQSDLS